MHLRFESNMFRYEGKHLNSLSWQYIMCCYNFLTISHHFLTPHFSGTIPTEIGQLNNLRFLYLSWNALEGTIPSTIGNIRSLEMLRLSQNYLQGSIPDSIGKLTDLIELRFDNNPHLGGNLSDALFELSKLVYLDLSDCSFTGTLSGSVGNLSVLATLRIANNQLVGTLPSELGGLWELSVLLVQGNSFTGEVPGLVCCLENFQAFEADCDEDNLGYVELSCPCCTLCCKPDGKNCLPVASGE